MFIVLVLASKLWWITILDHYTGEALIGTEIRGAPGGTLVGHRCTSFP